MNTLSKIQIEGETEFPKNKLTKQLLNLIKGRLSTLKEEINEIKNDLHTFQKRYSMTNEEFLQKFESGELEDDSNFFVWKGSINLLENLFEEEKMLRDLF